MRSEQTNDWASGYDTAVNEAIRVIDAMRGPGVSNLASPILLRIRAELLALRETRGELLSTAA